MGVQGLEQFEKGTREPVIRDKAIVVDLDNVIFKLWHKVSVSNFSHLNDHDLVQVIYRQGYVLDMLWEALQPIRHELRQSGRRVIYVSKWARLHVS
jgi:hypothetical protein